MGHNLYVEKHCLGGWCLYILKITCLNLLYTIPVFFWERGTSLAFSSPRGLKKHFITTDLGILFSMGFDIATFMYPNIEFSDNNYYLKKFF